MNVLYTRGRNGVRLIPRKRGDGTAFALALAVVRSIPRTRGGRVTSSVAARGGRSIPVCGVVWALTAKWCMYCDLSPRVRGPAKVRCHIASGDGLVLSEAGFVGEVYDDQSGGAPSASADPGAIP